MSSISSCANHVQANSYQSTPSSDHLSLHPTSAIHIAISTTNDDQQEPNERPNKYLYLEFAGPSGERRLLGLAEQFAPLSLWRTWQAAVSFQMPGEECYVGVDRIVERVGPKARKIYLDLKAMVERGWLTMTRKRKAFPNKEGETVYHPVTVKDFTGFYETAHDYYLWLNSPDYIEPEQENVPLILEDQELTKRLIRFENYRRLLVGKKPGRKEQDQKDFYQQQLDLIEERRTPVQEVQLSANSPAHRDSSYRVINEESNIGESNSSSSSTSEKGTVLEPKTIRNSQVETQSETEDVQNVSHTEHVSKSTSNTPLSPSEKGGASAKDVKRTQGYTEEELKQDTRKRGAAAAGIPAEHHEKLNGGKDQAERQAQRERENVKQERRPEREIPAQIVKEVTEYAQQYDDSNILSSDVTRAAKIFFTAAQAIDFFQETLYWAFFDEAVKAAKRLRGCEHTNTKGKRNRVPYFFSCFENAFSFSLEELVYLRTDNPLYTDYSLSDVIDHLRQTYQQQYNEGRTRLDYREWLQSVLDHLEQRKEPKQRNNRTTREY